MQIIPELVHRRSHLRKELLTAKRLTIYSGRNQVYTVIGHPEKFAKTKNSQISWYRGETNECVSPSFYIVKIDAHFPYTKRFRMSVSSSSEFVVRLAVPRAYSEVILLKYNCAYCESHHLMTSIFRVVSSVYRLAKVCWAAL